MARMLAYDVQGDGSCPAVVALHGLLDNRRRFADLGSALSDGFRVFTVDLPGHGRSPRLPSYETGRHAAAVLEFLAAVVGRPAILVGHSLGGIVAAELAAKWPERVRGILLEDSPLYDIAATDRIGTRRRRDFPDWHRLLIDIHSGQDPIDAAATFERIRRATIGDLVLADLPEPELRAIAQSLAEADPNVVPPYFPGADCGFDPAWLRDIECPVTLVNGADANGGAWRQATLRRLGKALPDARIVADAALGHHVWPQNPDLFLSAFHGLTARL